MFAWLLSSVLSVLMRYCLLAGVTGESCSAITRMLGAPLEHSLVWHILPLREPLAFVSALLGASAVPR